MAGEEGEVHGEAEEEVTAVEEGVGDEEEVWEEGEEVDGVVEVEGSEGEEEAAEGEVLEEVGVAEEDSGGNFLNFDHRNLALSIKMPVSVIYFYFFSTF